jgi:hypothetical protein
MLEIRQARVTSGFIPKEGGGGSKRIAYKLPFDPFKTMFTHHLQYSG